MKKQTFTRVWDAIENTRAAAASMKARSELMIKISEIVVAMDITQAKAARELGITQPRLNDLLKGKIDRFSLDALFDLAARVGIKINLELKAA